MERVKEYVKNNKYYVAVMVVGLILLVIQMKFETLYADDLTLGHVANNNNIFGAVNFLIDNYINWGGGPTPFIAIFFMWFDLKIWKIFNCLIIFFTIIILTKIISYKNEKMKPIVSFILWSCIFILNIYISRETLYWLDGSLAYVLTSFQLILYVYIMFSRLIMKNREKKYDLVLIPILAFFSGWTGPQTGALTCLIPILILIWAKFINKEKIDKRYIIFCIVGILGFLVEYLAPGNGVRMQEYKEYIELNFMQKIVYRIEPIFNLLFNYNDYKIASIPFYLLIIMGGIAISAKKINQYETRIKVKKVINISISILAVYFILLLVSKIDGITNIATLRELFTFKNLKMLYENNTLQIVNVLAYVFALIVLIDLIILSIYIAIKRKEILLPIAIISGLSSQLMMIFAPYTPLRATYVSLVFLWLAIGYLVKLAIEEKIPIKHIILLSIMVSNFNLGLIMLVITILGEDLVKSDYLKGEIQIILLLFGILVCINYTEVLYNYSLNEPIFYRNMERLERYDNNTKEIYLEKPVNAIYGFNEFVGIEWIEKSVKDYFKIPQDVDLKYNN